LAIVDDQGTIESIGSSGERAQASAAAAAIATHVLLTELPDTDCARVVHDDLRPTLNRTI
jgi:hypothetical protein